ncbi:hypothetical protein GCM10010214_31760 [Streptomyces abikoensis]|nr:hypothetical protein GCM10010214_31760 [Streptomyces abikoensis]
MSGRRYCSWCKEDKQDSVTVKIVHGDQVAMRVYACLACRIENNLTPISADLPGVRRPRW